MKSVTHGTKVTLETKQSNIAVLGEQCPHCKDSVETFSTAALFRRHICRTHDAYVKGTKTIKRRENPTGLTDTTDHLRCSRCLSCITSETQHRVWCAAKRFEVLTKVIAGSCDADHARVRATSLGTRLSSLPAKPFYNNAYDISASSEVESTKTNGGTKYCLKSCTTTDGHDAFWRVTSSCSSLT